MSNLSNFYQDLKGEPAQGTYEMSLTQKYALGCRYKKPDGRVYHYVKAGGADLVAGNLIQSAALQGALTTVQADLTPAACAAGTYFVTAAIDTTEQPKDTFKDGWIAITDGDAANAMGDLYRVKTHPLSATNIILELYEPLKRAITTSSRVGLLGNIYKNVIQAPVTTPSGVVVGVAPTIITTLYYGWIQTWGIANILSTSAIVAGEGVILDVGGAGSVTGTDAGAVEGTLGQGGWAVTATDSGFVYLTITP